MVVSELLKHLKIPVEAGGGIGGFGTNSCELRNKEDSVTFSGSFGILLPCLLLFFKEFIF